VCDGSLFCPTSEVLCTVRHVRNPDTSPWGNTFPVETSGSSVAECVSLQGPRHTSEEQRILPSRHMIYPSPPPSLRALASPVCTLAEGLRGYSYLQTFETFESFTLLCRQHLQFTSLNRSVIA
jgi:hypothetical protein